MVTRGGSALGASWLDQPGQFASAFEAASHGPPCLLGELDGVADNVDENLLESGRVGLNRLGDQTDELDIERQFLGFGAHPHERNYFFDNSLRKTRDVFHFHLTRFDLGHVENVIDDAKQVFTVLVNRLDGISRFTGRNFLWSLRAFGPNAATARLRARGANDC